MAYCQVAFLLMSYIIGVTQGQNNVEIIGGHYVSIEKVPFIASLRLSGIHHLCGASIISEQFVLTAAHCILPNRTYKVLVGTDDIYNGGELYDIEKITVHENYRNLTYENDITIIKLTKPLNFGSKVGKVSLSNDTKAIKKGTIMQVTGWGYTKPKGNVSETLQQVSIPAVNKGICKRAYKYNFVKITSKMLCAGEHGRDSCQGDSGGPLTLDGIQVGLVSYGGVCGINPGIYTKVAAYQEWITNIIGTGY